MAYREAWNRIWNEFPDVYVNQYAVSSTHFIYQDCVRLLYMVSDIQKSIGILSADIWYWCKKSYAKNSAHYKQFNAGSYAGIFFLNSIWNSQVYIARKIDPTTNARFIYLANR